MTWWDEQEGWSGSKGYPGNWFWTPRPCQLDLLAERGPGLPFPVAATGSYCPLVLDTSVPFVINDKTGTITVSQPLDREQLPSEEVLLEVTVSRRQQGEPHPLPLPGPLQPSLSSCPGT